LARMTFYKDTQLTSATQTIAAPRLRLKLPSRLCRLFALLLCAFAFFLAANAHGQSGAESDSAAPASASAPTYGALADLLENEETRKRIISELRAQAGPLAPPPVPASSEKVDSSAQRESSESDERAPNAQEGQGKQVGPVP